ncbi:MAG: hypothetical protein WBN04_10675 [Paracoccaceae bacterium]
MKNRHSGTFGEGVTGVQRNSVVDVSETDWGYIIRPGDQALTRAAYGEMAASFGGVLLGMSAFGLWLIPGTNGSADLVPFKLGATVIFFVGAAFLYLIARRGLCQEVHIDLVRRVLRTARRNRHGNATPVWAVPIAEVESVFMQRAKSSFLRNRLCVRFAGDRTATEIAVAPESELAPILQRLSVDLREDTGGPPARRKPTVAATQAPSAFAAR